MSNRVFPLLVCPLTKQRLLPVTGNQAQALKSALEDRQLRYLDGTPLTAEGSRVSFLITENERHLYTVIDDVPVLLESRQVDIEAVDF